MEWTTLEEFVTKNIEKNKEKIKTQIDYIGKWKDINYNGFDLGSMEGTFTELLKLVVGTRELEQQLSIFSMIEEQRVLRKLKAEGDNKPKRKQKA